MTLIQFVAIVVCIFIAYFIVLSISRALFRTYFEEKRRHLTLMMADSSMNAEVNFKNLN